MVRLGLLLVDIAKKHRLGDMRLSVASFPAAASERLEVAVLACRIIYGSGCSNESRVGI